MDTSSQFAAGFPNHKDTLALWDGDWAEKEKNQLT